MSASNSVGIRYLVTVVKLDLFSSMLAVASEREIFMFT